MQYLHADEVARAQRFKRAAHAAQWAYFHAALREILGVYTGVPPLDIRFRLGENGKPDLSEVGEYPVFFNLSHAGTMALVALTRCAPIGVDIEPVRELNDREALVKRFFSTTEQAAFAEVPEVHRNDCFFNIWTRKEALIKANGIGLSAPLDAFDVPVNHFSGWHLPTIRPPLPANTNFPLQHIDPATGYVAAVALELANSQCERLPEVHLYHFQPDRDRVTRQTSR